MATAWCLLIHAEALSLSLSRLGTKRLKLKYDNSAFKFCFQFQLAPLHRGAGAEGIAWCHCYAPRRLHTGGPGGRDQATVLNID